MTLVAARPDHVRRSTVFRAAETPGQILAALRLQHSRSVPCLRFDAERGFLRVVDLKSLHPYVTAEPALIELCLRKVCVMEGERSPVRVALVVKRILADAISGGAAAHRDLEIHTFAQSPKLDSERVLGCRPRVVVADIDAPNQCVWPLARAFRFHDPAILLIALASQLSPENIELSRELQTESLVLKSNSLEHLLNSVRMVVRAQNPTAVSSIPQMAREGQRFRVDAGESRFSPVQLDILRSLAAGMSVKETAAALDRTVKSVDGHKTRIMGKLGIRDRAGLVRYAIREGLLTP